MKSLLITTLVIFLAGFIYSQSNNDVEKVKTSVNSLFEICKANDVNGASKIIIYTGRDEKRHMAGFYDMNDRKEASKIKRVMKKVAAFLKISDDYQFGEYEKTQTNEKDIHSIEVIFKSGEQELTTTFSFVEFQGELLLSDLN